MLDNYKQQTLALELIKRKARVAMIHEETNISIKWLRRAYRQYHGFSARSGDTKQSIHALTRTNQQYKEVVAFVACYRQAQFIGDPSGIYQVVNAFDAFKKIHPASKLDFAETGLIIEELKANRIELTRCPVCNCWNLLRARMNHIERCGVCKELIRDK